MFRKRLGLWVLGFAAAVSSASCSSDDGGGSGGSGGTPSVPDKTCEEAGNCVEPPSETGGTTPPKTDPPTTLAISQLFLGDTDREGTVSATAWKERICTRFIDKVYSLAPKIQFVVWVPPAGK